MHRENAAGLQMVAVDHKGLTRQQMHRDRVGAEGVDHDDAEFLPGLLQRQSAVA